MEGEEEIEGAKLNGSRQNVHPLVVTQFAAVQVSSSLFLTFRTLCVSCSSQRLLASSPSCCPVKRPSSPPSAPLACAPAASHPRSPALTPSFHVSAPPSASSFLLHSRFPLP